MGHQKYMWVRRAFESAPPLPSPPPAHESSNQFAFGQSYGELIKAGIRPPPAIVLF